MNNKHIHEVCIVMVMHACESRGQKKYKISSKYFPLNKGNIHLLPQTSMSPPSKQLKESQPFDFSGFLPIQVN